MQSNLKEKCIEQINRDIRLTDVKQFSDYVMKLSNNLDIIKEIELGIKEVMKGNSYDGTDLEDEYIKCILDYSENFFYYYDYYQKEFPNAINQYLSLMKSESPYWIYSFLKSKSEYESTHDKTYQSLKCAWKYWTQNAYHMYLYLCKFLRHYNRYFSDYDNALIMLCKYFRADVNTLMIHNKDFDDVVEAFYWNIRFCGSSNDIGYSFTGIDTIKAHMNDIPSYVINAIIGKYKIRDVIFDYSSVIKHQIHSLLSCYEDGKMNILLPGILITNYVLEVYAKKLNNYEILERWQDSNLEDFWKDSYIFDKENNSYVLLRTNRWDIYLNGEKKINICVLNEYIHILDKNDKDILTEEIDSISFSGWKYSGIISNKKVQKVIQEYFSEVLMYPFKVSYLFIDGYHGCKNQHINFDHRFAFDFEKNEISDFQGNLLSRPYLYSQYIYSMSCIVGKNGTGKTSLIVFIGQILPDLFISYDKYNHNEDYSFKEIFEEKKLPLEVKFLVIFSYGKINYFFTNISEIKCISKKLVNYVGQRELFFGYTGDKNKFFMFSNKVNLFEVVKMTYSTYNSKQEKRNEILLKDYTIGKDLLNLLEKSSRKELENESKVNFTSVLCYYFIFLKYLYDLQSNDKFNKNMLWNDFDIFSCFIENDLNTECKILLEKKVFLKSDEEIINKFFSNKRFGLKMSSGQEAKFSLLAKLYWCMEGCVRFVQLMKSIIHVDELPFNLSDCIQEDDNSIILIDEGEIYYHPEWQRQLIDSIVTIINTSSYKCDLQIVIATNSPYILSDFYKEDVAYVLSNEDKKIPITETFGQNIHTLLTSPFFMNSTMGAVAFNRIKYVVEILNKIEQSNQGNFECAEYTIELAVEDLSNIFGNELNKSNLYEHLMLFANSVGEEIYRYQLRQLVEKVFPASVNACNSIDELECMKRKIDAKIEFLRGTKND